MIEFGRDICGNLDQSMRREWLVTNRLGGFASGTIAGCLTRRYHGLLIAALKPPLGRTLLLTKLDETATFLGQEFPLFTNCWMNDNCEPDGYRFIESFRLERSTPVWTYALADALLEKRIFMQIDQNTTFIHYQYIRGVGQPIELNITALVNARDYHGITRSNFAPTMRIEQIDNGLYVNCPDLNSELFIYSPQAQFRAQQRWMSGFHLEVEAYRGEPSVEDHLQAATLKAVLLPGSSLTIVATTSRSKSLDAHSAYQERIEYEQELIHRSKNYPTASQTHSQNTAQDNQKFTAEEQLVLAVDQFIVRRESAENPQGISVIAGYPWFSDWGRDTMISLPGLTLATGRFEDARRILKTFAAYVDQGMLPNRFPDVGKTPEYNTVDATLWYFEAIRAYVATTNDIELLHQLFPVLQDIINWHVRGTRYQIHVDPQDGLLYAGQAGVQLTWMDAKVENWVVTPRIGKPIEVNALWYNALCICRNFAQHLGLPYESYSRLANACLNGFQRFWNQELGYCFDVLDSPNGNDPKLRPNQLIAASIHNSPLTHAQIKVIVDVCAQHLLTSHGLRSLAMGDPEYIGKYGGDRYQRDAAYHQGTTWGWLIGPFISAYLRAYGDPITARAFLRPLLLHLTDHGIGSVSEIFNGDPPFSPRGCIAQAWSVAEILRVLHDLDHYRET